MLDQQLDLDQGESFRKFEYLVFLHILNNLFLKTMCLVHVAEDNMQKTAEAQSVKEERLDDILGF